MARRIKGIRPEAVGQAFEDILTIANRQYQNGGVALIHKRPTPIKPLKTKGVHVLSGVFEEKSTVDYDGVYEGRPIYFEAKNTTSETSFKLENIKPHQLAHMEAAASHGAICFVLVHFMAHRKTFYVSLSFLRRCIKRQRNGGRKSIAYSEFEEHCPEVPTTRRAVLDYLLFVEKELNGETA